MCIRKFIFVVAFLVPALVQAQLPPDFSGKIAVKYKSPLRSFQTTNALQKRSGIEDARGLRFNRNSKSSSVLENIVILRINKNVDYRSFCDSLSSRENVVYAEPIFHEQLLEMPSDPSSAMGGPQRYLETIQAYEAWNISKSSEDIVIGIIDTGTDTDHEDIQGNLYVNASDPVNGIDDDGNGFIDDYSGYDFADEDNDPTADGNQHGTHVGGIAAADTDNGLGIASVGYNAKWSPLKIFTTSLTASAGSYDAVIYAADNGYDIINLSWGSTGSFSQFNQDIINYAVLENDVVVVAAAGNTPNDIAFYPAAYQNVLSVAASDFEDRKASFSTFHKTVDLMAPGVGIYSTQNNNTYDTDNGTSHAAPQVAGVAALIKSKFPDYDAVQIMERIRATTERVSYSDEAIYQGKLGTGRLNAYKAVSQSKAYSIRNIDYSFSANDTGSIYPGDTVDVRLTLVNYLDPVLLPKFELSALSDQAVILGSGVINGNFLDTYDTVSINEFKILVKEALPKSNIELLLTFSYDDGSSTSEILELSTSDDVVHLTSQSVVHSFEGNGNIGENEDIAQTSDFQWQNITSTRLGFLIKIGNTVHDNLADTWTGTTKTSDFQTEASIRRLAYPTAAQSFQSAFTSTNGLVQIHQSLLTSTQYPNGTLQNYELINLSADTLTSINLGFFTNSDIIQGSSNSATWDQNETQYTFWKDSVTAALRLKGLDSVRSTVFDLDSIVSVETEASDQLILELIDTEKDSIGFGSSVNSAGLLLGVIDTLKPGEQIRFALLVASDSSRTLVDQGLHELEQLQQLFISNPPVTSTYFSCEGGSVQIGFENDDIQYFFSDPFASDTIAISDSLFIDGIKNDTLIFHSSQTSGFQAPIRAIQVIILENIASFSAQRDTLLIPPGGREEITYFDESLSPMSWTWDFGNGQQAFNIQNPTVSYKYPGEYTVRLAVENEQGCQDTTLRQLTVIERPAGPGIESAHVCPGSVLAFESTNELKLYLRDDERTLFLSGKSLKLDAVSSDTVFYISRVMDNIESLRERVEVTFQKINPTISLSPDLQSPHPGAAIATPEDRNYSVQQWFNNGDLMGSPNSDSLLMAEIANGDILQAVVSSIEGCVFTISDTVDREISAPVSIADFTICPGDDLIINAPSDSLYAFYADADLTQLIAKNTSLLIEDLISDTLLHVVNIGTLIPGKSKSVAVFVDEFKVAIKASPDTLYIQEDFKAKFSATENLSKARWFVDSILQTTDPEATLFFGKSGRYFVELVAENEIGCQAYDSLYFTVLEELPLALGSNPWLIKVFPNPSNQDQYLYNPTGVPLLLEIYEPSGRKMWQSHSGNITIELPDLLPGLYLLHVKINQETQLIRRLIRR